MSRKSNFTDQALSSVFGSAYSSLYDIFYQDKDYGAECDTIEEIFRRYSGYPVKTILDIGCGTGNHAIRLAQRGYEVTGVDISPHMLTIARSKVISTQAQPNFLLGDARFLNLGKTFDAVLMMFAVLGYQLTNEDIFCALQTVRRHLNPEGLFICDVWYGPAVLSVRPSDRIKVIDIPTGRVFRYASGSLNTLEHLSVVKFHFLQVHNRAIIESEESHQMRYFFPQELSFFLRQAGLQLVRISDFAGGEKLPDESTWNVLVVGREA